MFCKPSQSVAPAPSMGPNNQSRLGQLAESQVSRGTRSDTVAKAVLKKMGCMRVAKATEIFIVAI